MSKHLTIYTDGASKGNPGPSGVGVVIYCENIIVKEVSEFIGEATNNIAEYTAIIRALEEAKKLEGTELNIFTDSELIHRQLVGVYKVKNPGMMELYTQAQKLASQFKKISIQHVRREKNKEADQLASSAALKKQVKVVASTFFNVGEESPSSKG